MEDFDPIKTDFVDAFDPEQYEEEGITPIINWGPGYTGEFSKTNSYLDSLFNVLDMVDEEWFNHDVMRVRFLKEGPGYLQTEVKWDDPTAECVEISTRFSDTEWMAADFYINDSADMFKLQVMLQAFRIMFELGEWKYPSEMEHIIDPEFRPEFIFD